MLQQSSKLNNNNKKKKLLLGPGNACLGQEMLKAFRKHP